MNPTPLQVTPLRTPVFHLGDSLEDFVAENLQGKKLSENSVVAVTSKIISLSEKAVVPRAEISKLDLVKREADLFLGEINHGTRLTIKHNMLIPAAGIDESNAEGDFYILLPTNPFASAQRLRRHLKKITGLANLGILVTDSHSMPMRLGVTGVAVAYAGFSAIRDRVGDLDLFGRPLKITKMDLIDGLAAAAVLMMGEADESCPLAVIEGAPVNFVEQVAPEEILVPVNEDLYEPLYKALIEREKREK